MVKFLKVRIVATIPNSRAARAWPEQRPRRLRPTPSDCGNNTLTTLARAVNIARQNST